MKKVVRLTENKLRQMISETVKKVLKESADYEALYDEIQSVTNNIINYCGMAKMNDSISDENFWGVLWDGAVCHPLGMTPHRQSSKIARFVCAAQPRVWHGYPVDYVNDPQHDCPGYEVLHKWAEQGIISKSKIAKLIGGQGWND